jgi:hypothetical protein
MSMSEFKMDEDPGKEGGAFRVLTELVDGSIESSITELLVHVVGAGARVIAQGDTEVLDGQGLLLVDLIMGTLIQLVILTRGGWSKLTSATETISPDSFLTFFT